MRLIKTNFKRANIVESYHKIKLLIKDLNGKTLINSGNENDFIYPRSSIKIFQAIPFINSNAINKFKLNSKIIALSCSSHRGESYHLKELEKWAEKILPIGSELQVNKHDNEESITNKNNRRAKILELRQGCEREVNYYWNSPTNILFLLKLFFLMLAYLHILMFLSQIIT